MFKISFKKAKANRAVEGQRLQLLQGGSYGCSFQKHMMKWWHAKVQLQCYWSEQQQVINNHEVVFKDNLGQSHSAGPTFRWKMAPTETAEMIKISGHNRSVSTVRWSRDASSHKDSASGFKVKQHLVNMSSISLPPAKNSWLLCPVFFCSTSTLHEQNSLCYGPPWSVQEMTTDPWQFQSSRRLVSKVDLICDGQMNPWLILLGWTEDDGKAKYEALEKQEMGQWVTQR